MEFGMVCEMLRPDEYTWTEAAPEQRSRLLGWYTLHLGPRTEAQERTKVPKPPPPPHGLTSHRCNKGMTYRAPIVIGGSTGWALTVCI